MTDTNAALLTPTFMLADQLRRGQAYVLGQFGFAPRECHYHVLVSGGGWRVREYVGAGSGPPLLIISAQIKQPYIWDLAPAVSASRSSYSRSHDLRTGPAQCARCQGHAISHAGHRDDLPNRRAVPRTSLPATCAALAD